MLLAWMRKERNLVSCYPHLDLSRHSTSYAVVSVVHLTLDGVNGKWRWRRNLRQIDGENSKSRCQSSEFSDGNAVNYDRYLRCHFWMTPYVHNTGSSTWATANAMRESNQGCVTLSRNETTHAVVHEQQLMRCVSQTRDVSYKVGM